MHYPASELVIDPVLIRKYDVSGPRYTSYPTADRFVEAFGEPQLRQWLARRNIGGFSQPLSLYVHLPFCEHALLLLRLQQDRDPRPRADRPSISSTWRRNWRCSRRSWASARDLHEMHWGGGTPNFLAREEMAALVHAIEAQLRRARRRSQYSIEIDPRSAEPGLMAFLAELGFNRVSLGVQDFDPAVQKAVHRVQSVEPTQRVIEEARASGLRSVNLDLIYGLPKQTLDSFNRTLDQVLRLDPDRIALYSYAHLPTLFKPQRRIARCRAAVGRGQARADDARHRPPDARRLPLHRHGPLRAAGRRARALAQAHGQLARSFQGYSTQPGDLLGLGVSAIGQIGPTYYQNLKELERYEEALDAGRLPVMRGVELTADDLVRRAVIQALMCHFRVSIESIELAHLIDFRSTFAAELADLRPLAQDGLVELAPDWIVVTPKGRLLVRAIAMVFDRYLRQARAARELFESDMNGALPLSLFIAGLASGLHCAGMCGGISAGFSLLQKEQLWPRQLAFNFGRIASYATAGAAAGALGSAGAYAAAVLPAQAMLFVFSSVFVTLVGTSPDGPGLAAAAAGKIRIAPLAAPAANCGPPAAGCGLPHAFAAGMAWGWLPCGLVYGALLAAVFAGGAAQGALAMAAFGAGTLPWLLVAGVAAARLRQWAHLHRLRRAGGLLLAGLGTWGIAHGVEQTILCL